MKSYPVVIQVGKRSHDFLALNAAGISPVFAGTVEESKVTNKLVAIRRCLRVDIRISESKGQYRSCPRIFYPGQDGFNRIVVYKLGVGT